MTSFGSCESKTTNKIIPLAEKGVSVHFHNDEKKLVRKIQIDRCHFNPRGHGSTLCCDWLLIDSLNGHHFVELKGHDVDHAVLQLGATIDRLGLKKSTIEKRAYVIMRSDSSTRTDIAILKAKFLSDYKGLLRISRSGSKYLIPAGIR